MTYSIRNQMGRHHLETKQLEERIVKKIVLAFFVFLFIAGQAFAAVNDPADIKAVETAVENLRQALLKADQAAIDKLLTPDVIYVHSAGAVDNLAIFKQKLAEIDSYKRIDILNQVVATTENSAVVSHIFDMTIVSKGTNNDQPRDMRLGVVQVWRKIGGEWALSARKSFILSF